MFFVYLFLILTGISLIFYLLRRWQRSRTPLQQFYVCLDGHLVRSRGEWMIDAALQYLGIPHEYEPRLQIGRQTIHPDFGLGHNIYVEYWGLRTSTYLKSKRLKQNLYKRGNVHLINIENDNLKNLLHFLQGNLRKYEGFFPQFHNLLQLAQEA